MHGTNLSVWIDAFLIRYTMVMLSTLSMKLQHLVYEVHHG
jgi:hypothetical protein